MSSVENGCEDGKGVSQGSLPIYVKHDTRQSPGEELLRPIVKKYAPADRIEQMVKLITNDPSRVLVVLQPEKIVTN